jgi:hypothetical protein
MKILSASEIKQASESERVKDITRTETTKKALAEVQRQLDESEAKFEVALANQRSRWANEEETATRKVLSLAEEIKNLEEKKRLALIPIEREKEIAHNLFIQAESTLQEAKETAKKAEESLQHNQELEVILQEKIDGLSERENKLDYRDRNLVLREEAAIAEREQIKKLSQELSIKLTKL